MPRLGVWGLCPQKLPLESEVFIAIKVVSWTTYLKSHKTVFNRRVTLTQKVGDQRTNKTPRASSAVGANGGSIPVPAV